jgi:PAS domain S-box-containing protein
METRLRELEAELEAVRGELQAVQEKQRAGDEIFRRFSDSGIIGIAVFELSGKLAFANEAVLKMIGCTAEEMAAGQITWDQLTPPEWTERAREAIEELKTRGSCAPHEREYFRCDGTRFWGLFTGVMMGAESAVAFLFDITERVEVEQERARLLIREQEARARAETVERRLTLLTEATGALIGSLNLDRLLVEILALSRRLVTADAYAIWRLDRAAGRWGIAAAEGLSAEYQSAVVETLLHSQAAPSTPMVVSEIDQEPLLAGHRALLEQEGVRSMLVLPLPLHAAVEGTLVFYYHQGHQFDDIDLKVSSALANLAASAIATTELYEAASQRADQLVEADRLKDQFLAMLAHELRNPLNAICTAVEVTYRTPWGTAAYERAREVIERQSMHMARLVDELLDVSRITHARIELHPQRLSLARLVRDTAENHRSLLEAVGVSLNLKLPDGPVWVEGDPTRLHQTLGNLLQNAAKFTDRGGRVSVQLAADDGEGMARMTVADTGIGIAPELLPSLFQPFVQADRSLDRARGGLGLGLTLVKGIVELHGGRVSASSEGVGHGSTFVVEIPLQPAPEGADALSDATVVGPDKRRVLIIEDNTDAAETLRDLLELFGHRVEVAYSGPAGVEMARLARPDVVLCDLGLPGMDGYAVAAALRQDPATTSSRLIAVTGYGQAEDLRRSAEAGFDAHLTKPVEAELLQQVLE